MNHPNGCECVGCEFAELRAARQRRLASRPLPPPTPPPTPVRPALWLAAERVAKVTRIPLCDALEALREGRTEAEMLGDA